MTGQSQLEVIEGIRVGTAPLGGPQDFIYYMFLNGMHPRDAIDMETGKVTASDVNQTKFFETVFMQFEDGLVGSIGSHYDVALDDNADLRETMELPK